jgi:ribosomal protein S6/ribosomal protein S18
MRNYETIVIFKTGASEANISTINKKIEKVVTKKPGKLIKKDEWGIKTLAYPIKKEKQGKYAVWFFNADAKTVAELDKAIRFEEDILRYITLVTDDSAQKAQAKKAKKETPKEKKPTEEGQRERDPVDVYVDYKDIITLARFVTDRGKIVPRRVTGVNASSQKRISQAVKRARQIALLSYVDGFFPDRPQQERPQFDRFQDRERGDRHDRHDRSERH